MSEKHYKEKLSAFLNQELPKDERQMIAGHLLQCERCRAEHDQIKLGASLAGHLKRADAPENLWNEIETVLDGERKRSQVSLRSGFSFFNSHGLLAAAAVLLICFGLFAAAYFGGLFRGELPEMAKNDPIAQNSNVEAAKTQSTSGEVLTNPSAANTQIPANVNPSVSPSSVNAKVELSPKFNVVQPATVSTEIAAPAWNVEAIAGTPRTGNQTIAEKGKLTVGEILETDANSKARIQVANIGQVELAPNSRVQLVKTTAKEHRLSLKRGQMHAKILAPPRLFIVDTPSAVAVDLGCEYTLEVDRAGNSRLHVTSGFVALETGGRESIVPAGAICLTRRGKGLGTPFSDDASAEFRAALFKFDFENGGSKALQAIIKESRLYDALTLWHLLARVPKADRETVFDALAAQVRPPNGVTREGILRLDKKMLEDWWTEIEIVWFG